MIAARARPLNGWHVLALFTAFFAVVIVSDVAFAVLAYRSAPGQAAKDPYEAGLLYQRQLDAKADEAALGWQAAVVRKAEAVELAIRDRNGEPVTGLKVKAAFNRPATERGGIDATLHERSPGVYGLTTRGWEGAWDMRAVATQFDGQTFEIESRLQWP